MHNFKFILLLALGALVGREAGAQIVGTDCFLQGQFLEVGVDRMGAFGTCSSPATFHPHVCCGTGTAFTPGGNLDVVYDWGHDGWSVGAPPLMGDYTIPGYPQEGWSIQVGGTEYRNWAGGGACTGPFTVPGGITGYTSIGGTDIGVWTGSVAGLSIRQETRVDTDASWVVVTTKMYNTTAAPIANIYYERTCDPDNTSFWSGSSATRNIIVHQNEDYTHKVMVSTHGTTTSFGTPSYTYNQFNSFMALCTKDCRAKCGTCSGLFPSTTPQNLWNGTSGVVISALHDSNYMDQGIWLVFNVGTIAANDSAAISYAYLYSEPGHIDSVFPDPVLTLNGHAYPTSPPPTPNIDTFRACDSVGLTTVQVDLTHGDEKTWALTKWTWTPAIGLSATTGAHVTINLPSLLGTTTYTITGTGDSTSALATCKEKTFYLTIEACGIDANEPCVGDTLKFTALGDTLGVTYRWYGPAPSTTVFGTTRDCYIYPATTLLAGTYTLIKTIAGVDDTLTKDVIVNALPILTLSSNQVDCAPIVNPLKLFCNPDSVCTSFSWVGPGGWTSTLQNPTFAGFDSASVGTFTVTAISDDGCKNSNTILPRPGPVADFSFVRMPGCPTDSVAFTNGSTYADLYEWTFDDGTMGYDRNPPLHIYDAGHKLYNVKLKVTSANGCTDTKTRPVDLSHTVTANFKATNSAGTIQDTICNGDPLLITDLSSATNATSTPGIASYEWDYGDGTAAVTTTGAPPAYTYANENNYIVTLTVTDSLGCVAQKKKTIYVIQPYITALSDTTICLTSPLQLVNSVWLNPDLEFPGYDRYTFTWTPSTYLSSATEQEPLFNALGTYTYTLTAVLDRHLCVATHEMTIRSVLPRQLQHVTQSTTLMYGNSIQLNADSELYYTWTPNDGSLSNNNVNNPVATPTVTTTYTVYGMDEFGCRDTASLIIRVDSAMSDFVPTAFTPNGDGLNDIFRMRGPRFLHMVEMRIYNRWGQQVFYTSNRESGWDGTFNGTPVDLGVYYYTVIVANPGEPQNRVYKGEVTLIR